MRSCGLLTRKTQHLVFTFETERKSRTPDTEISLGLEYFLNNEEKKEGNLTLNHFTEYYDRISYEEIVYSFYLFSLYL